MAHNLNYNDSTGKHSFFSVKEKAWHNLGQIVQHYPTSEEALKLAGLDFHVEKRPLYTLDGENFNADPETELIVPEIEVPNFFATVRTDNDSVLGVVGNKYQVTQNVDAFSFFDSIVCGGDGIQYETAGALGKGERIFITAKLPSYIRVGREDLIEKYIFLTSSHDGSGSITAAFTPVRIVCANTLNAALCNMEMVVRIRHTENARERLAEAHKIMGIATQRSEDFSEMFNHWSRVRITDREVKKLIELAMCPSPETLSALREGRDEDLSTVFVNTCKDVFEYAMTAETQQMETTKGTVFGAYNAITGYYQNVKNHKTADAKLDSIVYGGTAFQKSTKAFNLCDDFTKRGNEIFLFN